MSKMIVIDRALLDRALNALDSLVVRNRLVNTEYAFRAAALRAALEQRDDARAQLAQPPSQPLTSRQIQKIVMEVCDTIYPQNDESYSEADSVFYGAFVHAIERAHGIGEQH